MTSGPVRIVSPRRGRPAPRGTVLCVPHAGAGASVYNGWRHELPGLRVAAVQPPGREDRFREPPPLGLVELAATIVAGLEDLARYPLVLFGHSMGAIVAYEVCRLMAAVGMPAPVLLAASGHPPPTLMNGEVLAATEADLVDYLTRMGGAHLDEVLADPEWRQMLLGTLRADLDMYAGYRHHAEPVNPTPVVTFAGHDDEMAAPADMRAWAPLSPTPLRQYAYPGGHFFVQTARDLVLADLRTEIDRVLAARTAVGSEP